MPGFLKRLIELAKKTTTELTNDRIILAVGGTDEEWGKYLQGPRVLAIVRAANKHLAEHNLEIVSQGVKTNRWRVVTCAEANVRKAEYRISRADANMRNAHKALMDVVVDIRASKTLRQDARAWLELYAEPQVSAALDTMKYWADELMKDARRMIDDLQK